MVNAFAGKYLHREPGFTRFFLLLAVFGTGMNLMVLAGSIDVLFAGRELLGISSTLLIGFFLERGNAVRAAMRAFATYRVCDVGLLAAAVVVHGAVGSGDFERLFGQSWPNGTCLVPATTATIVCTLAKRCKDEQQRRPCMPILRAACRPISKACSPMPR